MTHPPNHPETESLRDLVRGLRTAASTVENVDLYVSAPAVRASMLHDVESDLSRLASLLTAAVQAVA